MIVVKYLVGMRTVGMLAWQDTPEGPQALGGISPPDYPGDRALPCTVVITDAGERLLARWQHPDDIAEISGQDRNVEECADLDAVRDLLIG